MQNQQSEYVRMTTGQIWRRENYENRTGRHLPSASAIEFKVYSPIKGSDLQTMALPALRRCTSPRRAKRTMQRMQAEGSA